MIGVGDMQDQHCQELEYRLDQTRLLVGWLAPLMTLPRRNCPESPCEDQEKGPSVEANPAEAA